MTLTRLRGKISQATPADEPWDVLGHCPRTGAGARPWRCYILPGLTLFRRIRFHPSLCSGKQLRQSYQVSRHPHLHHQHFPDLPSLITGCTRSRVHQPARPQAKAFATVLLWFWHCHRHCKTNQVLSVHRHSYSGVCTTCSGAGCAVANAAHLPCPPAIPTRPSPVSAPALCARHAPAWSAASTHRTGSRHSPCRGSRRPNAPR